MNTMCIINHDAHFFIKTKKRTILEGQFLQSSSNLVRCFYMEQMRREEIILS